MLQFSLLHWAAAKGSNLIRQCRTVYLDGLDELADAGLRERLLQLVLDTKAIEKHLSVVVTGRDYMSIPALTRFTRISLEPFDDPRLDEFISNWFKGDKKEEARFREQLNGSLRELMRIPLLGTLVMNVQQSLRSLPSSRVKLYDMFTSLLAGGWDFAKQINRGSRFGPEPKIATLAYVANRLHEQRLREFTESDFRAAVRQVLPLYKTHASEILSEVCRDALILSEAHHYGFLHHSFQEYRVATYLNEPSGEKARRAIRRFLSGDDWWGEVVKSLIALSKNLHDTRRCIEKAAHFLTSRVQETIVKPRTSELLGALAMANDGKARSV